MEGTYRIWLSKDPVGSVTVERQGLYYWFRCKCQLHSKVICRVMVSCGGESSSLGILVPVGEEYLLTKKLPVKEFEAGEPEFWITPRQLAKPQILSVDIYPEEPFRYITKLEKAYLSTKQGKMVIMIPDASSDA